jgi:hypothetical protein
MGKVFNIILIFIVVCSVSSCKNITSNNDLLVLLGLVNKSTSLIPKTGQTDCYDTDGNSIACAGTGQDGELRKGIAWPDPRFTNPNGSTPITGNVVLDKLTGLMWAGNGYLAGDVKTWQGALDYVVGMNAGAGTYGYTDWRLPNLNELQSLLIYDATQTVADYLNDSGFSNIQASNYWTSTTYSGMLNRAGYKNFNNGSGGLCDMKSNSWNVIAIRGTSTGPYKVLKTGQTGCWDSSGVSRTCSGTGEDGEYQKGSNGPSTRFTNTDGTTPITGDLVLDNLTGHIWTKTANTAGGSTTWADALTYINGMNSGVNENYGVTGWRLPNIIELESLLNYSQGNSATWLNGQGFSSVSNYYWSSTTACVPNKNFAMSIDTGGYAFLNQKTNNGQYVWAVRDKD